jgi:hypothetical protein
MCNLATARREMQHLAAYKSWRFGVIYENAKSGCDFTVELLVTNVVMTRL